MNRQNRTDEINRLRAMQKELQKDKENQERESKKAKLPALLQLAITAMKACREKTWHIKKQGSVDAAKAAELNKKVLEDSEVFKKAYRQIVTYDLKRLWAAELQKAYVQGAPEVLLIYYLSDNPERTRGLAYSLKKAADDYIRGWELLGKKNRAELPGPLEAKGNGALAVKLLIEQLEEGDEIQKLQAQILKIVFEPMAALEQKDTSEQQNPKGFMLGETIQ